MNVRKFPIGFSANEVGGLDVFRFREPGYEVGKQFRRLFVVFKLYQTDPAIVRCIVPLVKLVNFLCFGIAGKSVLFFRFIILAGTVQSVPCQNGGGINLRFFIPML